MLLFQQTQNAMLSQYGVENQTAGGKAALKTRGNAGTRAALSNIGNKVAVNTRAQAKKAQSGKLAQAPVEATKKVEKQVNFNL